MKVYIQWEHGDADFTTEDWYEFKTPEEVSEFLNFLYDLRGGATQYCHDHYKRENEHVDAVCEKYNHKFDGYIVADERYDYPIAVIENIHIKDGNKIKHIVWTKALEEKVIRLPKIGDQIEITSGQVCGYGKDAFGLKHSETIGYSDLEKQGLGQIEGTDGSKSKNYKSFDVKVKDIAISFGDRMTYKTEYTSFQYVMLCEFNGQLLTTHQNGYDKDFTINEDFLYYH